MSSCTYSDLSKKAKKHLTNVEKQIKMHFKNNTILSRRIENTWGISGVTVREIVHYLRVVEKEPICSDSSGYFYAKTREDAAHTIRQLRSRIKHINEAACALESANYPETEEQIGFGFKLEKKFRGYPD